MTTKTYKAKSAVSIVVRVGKTSKRITFDAMSDGTSTYKTTDEALQAAIERHRAFGKTFYLFRTVTVKTATEAKTATIVTAAETTASSVVTAESESSPALTQVTVTDAQSARQYLIETFGVSKTSVRSNKQLLEQAAAHGVEFIGI